MFSKSTTVVLTSAYKQLIDDDSNEFDVPKITDYIKRGADTTVLNKQGHTLLQVMLMACFNQVPSAPVFKKPSSVEFITKINFIDDMLRNIAILITAGCHINDNDTKMASELVELLVNKDMLYNHDIVHKRLMSIIDQLKVLDPIHPQPK